MRGREDEGGQEGGKRVRGGKEWARKREEIRWDLHVDLTLQIPLVGREE